MKQWMNRVAATTATWMAEHGLTYVKRLMLLALVLPLHELVHAGACLAFGGTVLHINPASHMVCGGTVSHIAAYDAFSGANELLTSLLFYGQAGRIHAAHMVTPLVRRTGLRFTGV